MTFMPRRVGPGIFGPVGGGWGGTTNSNVTLKQPQSLDIGATSEGEGLQLGLLNALQQVQQAGLQRTASPMGSIAQNLAPIFGAMIYGQILDRQAAAEQQAAQQKGLESAAGLEKTKAETKLVEAKTKKELQPDSGFKPTAEQQLADMANPQSPNYNPHAAQMWDFIQQGKLKVAEAQASARTGGEINTLNRKKEIADNTDIADQTLYKGRSFVNPMTGEVVKGGLTPNELKTGGYKEISKDNEGVLRSLKMAAAAVDEVDQLGNKVLRKDAGGLLGTPMTLAHGSTQKLEAEMGANPDASRLQTAMGLSVMPILRTMGEKGVVSDKDVARAKEVTLFDSQASKDQKIAVYRKLLSTAATAIGVSPSAIFSGVENGRVAGPPVDVDPSLESQIRSMYQQLKDRNYSKEEADALVKRKFGLK